MKPLPSNSTNHHDPIEGALHDLAATTEVKPQFATELEALLANHAQQMTTKELTWWQRWITQFSTSLQARRFVYGATALTLMLVLLLMATPTARATFWDWLHGFGVVQERSVAHQPVPLTSAVLVPENQPAISLTEIAAQAPFPVGLPQWLPDDLLFTGGFVEALENGTQVTLAYHLTLPAEDPYPFDAPLLFILISDGPIANRPFVAEEYIVPIRLDKTVGMYAQGGWQSNSPVTPAATTVDDLYWDETLDAAWLSWQRNGLNYLLYAQGLGTTQAEITQIATSIHVPAE